MGNSWSSPLGARGGSLAASCPNVLLPSLRGGPFRTSCGTSGGRPQSEPSTWRKGGAGTLLGDNDEIDALRELRQVEAKGLANQSFPAIFGRLHYLPFARRIGPSRGCPQIILPRIDEQALIGRTSFLRVDSAKTRQSCECGSIAGSGCLVRLLPLQFRSGFLGASFCQSLEGGARLIVKFFRHDNLHLGNEVSRSVFRWYSVSFHAQFRSTGSARRDLERDGSFGSRNINLCPQCGLG